MHSVGELKALHQDLLGEPAPKDVSHFELVKFLCDQISFSDLLESWSEKIYAHNTTLKLYQFVDLKSQEPISGGLKVIKARLGESWDKLTDKGYSPQQLKAEGSLLHISEMDKKAYFLFAYPGRTREVVEDLNVRYIVQPMFTIGVWDDATGTLQIRGQERQSVIAAKFTSYLELKSKDGVHASHLSIEDKDTFEKYKKALNGRTYRGKMSNPSEEVTDIEMKTNPDTELFDTKKYKDYVKEKYNLNSAGIDFAYKRKSYVVWIGFKTGTFWIRSGDVSEDLIDYVQSKLLTVVGI